VGADVKQVKSEFLELNIELVEILEVKLVLKEVAL
jgi:hypothetical protein